MIGRVKRIWIASGCAAQKAKIEVTRCETGRVSDLYGMRELEETGVKVWINPDVSLCVL